MNEWRDVFYCGLDTAGGKAMKLKRNAAQQITSNSSYTTHTHTHMPPKISFKPKIAATARSRKRVATPADGEGSDNDVHMRGEGAVDESEIMEDELQMRERLEEERLSRSKPLVKRDVLAVGSASSSLDASQDKDTENLGDDSSVQDTTIRHSAKMEDLTLEDSPNSPAYSGEGSMDMDQDQMVEEEEAREKEPDYADEGDELVKEIPVYLSQCLAKYLYLFQYPVRAAALPYAHGHGPSKARIKPLSQLIELELPIDTTAQEYNRDRGEELALGMNDKALRTALDGELDDEEEREMLDKQTLVSSLIPNATNYLAGVLRKGMFSGRWNLCVLRCIFFCIDSPPTQLHDLDELHLTPFHGAVQLRPSFKYLDKIDEKKKQATRKVSDEDNKEMQAKAKAEDAAKAKALQVTPDFDADLLDLLHSTFV